MRLFFRRNFHHHRALRFTRLLLAGLLSGLVSVEAQAQTQAQAQAQGQNGNGARVILSEDADYYGHDYRTVFDVPLAQCKAACIGDSLCRAFTYNSKARRCFLKSGFGELTSAPGAVAGRIVQAAPPDLGKPAPLAFLPASAEDEARRFVRDLSALAARATATYADYLRGARTSQDPRRAAQFYRFALALDGQAGAAVWNGLADTLLAIQTENYSERYTLVRDGLSAAVNAYRVSHMADERAQALALMGAALARQQVFRPALEAYKASLALADSAAVRAAFKQLYEEHKFRVLNYSVDAEAAVPRVCVQFSESLQRHGTDFSRFVTLNEAQPPAVDAEEQQVCVDGLRHGERYRLGLRAGIPSTVGEALDAPVVLDIYVRDRQPAARFTGQNFVVPRVGLLGVPVVSVNADRLQIEVYRIGERALTPAITEGRFLDQINRYAAEQIGDATGERVWRGELEVAKQLNREVTTSFPIDEALPERRPGVYVMVARPAGARDDAWQAQATQWFIVSDVGLASFSGTDGLHVFARSLSTAAPLGDVTLTLVARNNEVLGELRTDGDGHGRFAPGLVRAAGGLAPALVTARDAAGDYAFLDLSAPAFDLSDRGVTGRPAPAPLDVFAYTERGIYRAGDTVHVAALVRGETANAVGDVPLTFLFQRPDGVEYRRTLSRDQGAGGHALAFELPATAMRGTWRVAIHADPKAAALADARFLVEDFVPDRMQFDLTSAAATLPRAGAIDLQVAGRFLYGAPAAGLRLEGEMTLKTATGLAAYPGFAFGLADEEVPPLRQPLDDLPVTDGQGRASLSVMLADAPVTTRPLQAEIAVRMREGGGRALERALTLPVASAGPLVGIKPLFSSNTVGEGDTVRFEAIALASSGARAAHPDLKWQLVKLERNYQWYRANGSWTYEPVTFTRRIADGHLDIAADAPAHITAQVDWGRYRLEVTGTGADAPATSVEFSTGWYVDVAAVDTPDVLDLSLDKKTYKAGETAKLAIEPRFAGTALVTVAADKLIDMKTVQVAQGRNVIDLPVTDAWGAGAYVTASVYRPGDAAAKRGPARALGLKWAGLDVAERTLAVSMQLPAIIHPRETLNVPLTITGLDAGEAAYLTLAAVDVGILNVTRHEPPAPESWYFGQRQLGVEIRDLYGRLVDGMAGTPGRIRSGGGEPAIVLAAAPPTQEPIALFSGIVKADAGGKAQIAFDIPEFNGTLRLMAVAWSGDSVGHGTADVIVRDPVVLTVSLPRVLAPGDEAMLRLDIANMDGPAGAYDLSIEPGDLVAAAVAHQKLELGAGERRALSLVLTARTVGSGPLKVRLAHADGLVVEQTLSLTVRPAQPPVFERRVVTLQPAGGSLALDPAMLADRLPETAAATLSISRAAGLDVPSLLLALDRYPYGCAEQTTSRALPLLYLSEVAAQSGLGGDAAIQERVRKAIDAVLSYQDTNGGFGLWQPSSQDLWLNAYVADFLTRAREQGYAVADQAFAGALDNLRNALAIDGEVNGGGRETAYALYVLSRNRRASIGDLRYYADAKLADFVSPLAKAQLGAALALYGERARAHTAFTAAFGQLRDPAEEDRGRGDYGSRLRDGAAVLALAAESSPPLAPLPALASWVAQARQQARYTSTQENAWLLLAAHALMTNAQPLQLELDGEAQPGGVQARYTLADLAARKVSVTNRGADPVEAVLTFSGVPKDPLPAAGEGFAITRSYYTLDGKAIDLEQAGQNERFLVVLEVTEENAWPSRVLVSDLLPAGLEIANPGLVGSAELSAFAWLPEKIEPAHVEFRDDRFVAALDRGADDARTFTLAYMVRAVTPGRFVHPPASVEDMYRPYLNARTATGRLEVVGARP